jgi:hypothetical protein
MRRPRDFDVEEIEAMLAQQSADFFKHYLYKETQCLILPLLLGVLTEPNPPDFSYPERANSWLTCRILVLKFFLKNF